MWRAVAAGVLRLRVRSPSAMDRGTLAIDE
jgi:hypothetical protein